MEALRLWTWQLPDWDITSQKRDAARVAEAWGEDTAERLQPLYEKLYRELGTADLVWCLAHYKHWRQLEVRRLWVLDVPQGRVFRYTDSRAWKEMVDTSDRSAEDAAKSPAWHRLFLDEGEARRRIAAGEAGSVVPLLTVPIPRAWVVDSARSNKGTHDADARFADLPTSEDEARSFR